jgi:hypothetical protein
MQGGTVGSGHTFTISGTSNFPSMQISAWSGSAATPFDVENGAGVTFANTNQTGNVTPSTDNQLIVAGLTYDTNETPTINLGFTILDTDTTIAFGAQAAQIVYLIETTATAKNPTFSWPSNSRSASSIATFKAAGGGGSPVTTNFFPFFWSRQGIQ